MGRNRRGLLDLELDLEATESSVAHLCLIIAEGHSECKEYFCRTLKLEAKSEFYASAILIPFVGTFIPRWGAKEHAMT